MWGDKGNKVWNQFYRKTAEIFRCEIDKCRSILKLWSIRGLTVIVSMSAGIQRENSFYNTDVYASQPLLLKKVSQVIIKNKNLKWKL